MISMNYKDILRAAAGAPGACRKGKKSAAKRNGKGAKVIAVLGANGGAKNESAPRRGRASRLPHHDFGHFCLVAVHLISSST